MFKQSVLLFLLVTTSVQAQDKLAACAASDTKINFFIYNEWIRSSIDRGSLGDILYRTRANFAGIMNITLYYAVRGTYPKPLNEITVRYSSPKAKRCAEVMGKVLAENLHEVYRPESRQFRNGIVVRPWLRGHQGPNTINVSLP